MTAVLNQATLDLIKRFEGLRTHAYRDAVGVWTIGYGHTNMTGNPPRVVAGLQISTAEAEAILRRDLAKYEAAVRDAVSVSLNDNQYGALVSFCFNVGPGNLRRSSVLKRVNSGWFDDVPSRLMLWNRAGGRVLRGLTRRRQAEGVLFMTPPGTSKPEAPPPQSPAPGFLETIVTFILRLIGAKS